MRARVAWLTSLVALPAFAFSIATAFSSPCHEPLTAAAFSRARASFPAEQLPRVPSELEQKVSEDFAKNFGPADVPPEYLYTQMSLIMGVRAPDTGGHSLLDLDNTRLLHTVPSDQYSHALRGGADDGPEGDEVVAAGVRATVNALMSQARDALGKPRDEQHIPVTYDIDGYGLVKLQVWAPAYFAGRAAHALQDSFSHSLREDGFHRVVHFFNYADAITKNYDEARDGFRHSGSMDKCGHATEPITNAATDATTALLLAIDSQARLDVVLNDWVTTRPGCTIENAYCDSPWLALAAEDVSEPYLGCSSAQGLLVAGVMLLLLRRR